MRAKFLNSSPDRIRMEVLSPYCYHCPAIFLSKFMSCPQEDVQKQNLRLSWSSFSEIHRLQALCGRDMGNCKKSSIFGTKVPFGGWSADNFQVGGASMRVCHLKIGKLQVPSSHLLEISVCFNSNRGHNIRMRTIGTGTKKVQELEPAWRAGSFLIPVYMCLWCGNGKMRLYDIFDFPCNFVKC